MGQTIVITHHMADLDALGCGEYLTSSDARERVLRRACDSVPMTAGFPGIEPRALAAAMAPLAW